MPNTYQDYSTATTKIIMGWGLSYDFNVENDKNNIAISQKQPE